MARTFTTGAATATTLTGSLTDSATSFSVVAATGWPSVPFVIVIDRGTINEEKILVTARSGTSITACTRGYDGTANVAHSVGTNNVEHCISAVQIERYDVHESDVDGVAHSNLVNKTLVDAQGDLLVGSAADTLIRLAKGTSGLPLVAGASTVSYAALTSAGLAADSVGASQIAANAVGTTEIADGSVTPAKLSTGVIVPKTAIGGYWPLPGDVGTPANSTQYCSRPILKGSDHAGYLAYHGLSVSQNAVVVPLSGSIIGLSTSITGVWLSGSMTFEAYINDVGTGLSMVWNSDPPNSAIQVSQASGLDTFVAGDRLQVARTTAGSWGGTNGLSEIILWVALA